MERQSYMDRSREIDRRIEIERYIDCGGWREGGRGGQRVRETGIVSMSFRVS
jgi:hypothetical protein